MCARFSVVGNGRRRFVYSTKSPHPHVLNKIECGQSRSIVVIVVITDVRFSEKTPHRRILIVVCRVLAPMSVSWLSSVLPPPHGTTRCT